MEGLQPDAVADPTQPLNPQAQGAQPPLRATGFIQNEHGALIPVYQRDALHQYMANAHGRPSPIMPSRSPPHPAPIPSVGNAWLHPPHLAAYPGPYPINLASASSSNGPQSSSQHPMLQPPIWMSNPLPYSIAALQPSCQSIPAPTTPPASVQVSLPLLSSLSRAHTRTYRGSHRR